MDINFIISPIVGGAIGGFANWLAIQMIFFPVNEKKVFGIRIPFTPGLVPKERKRIAQSVASTVSNYFLSEDVIVNAVISSDSEKQFKKYINDLINEQKQSECTVGEIVQSITGKEFEKIFLEFRPKVIKSLSGYIKSSEFIDAIVDHLDIQFDNFIDKRIGEVLSNKYFDNNSNVTTTLNKFINSDTFKNLLSQFIYLSISSIPDDKKLKDILPEYVFDRIKNIVINNSDKMSELLVEYITSSTVQFKLRKYIKNSFDNSLKLKIVSKVIDAEKIFENMFEELIEFLEQPESHKEIANFIIKMIDCAQESTLKDIVKDYNISIDNNSIIEILNQVLVNVSSEQLIDKATFLLSNSNFAETKISDILNAVDENIINNKKSLSNKVVKRILKQINIEEMLKRVLDSKFKNLESQKVSSIASLLSKSNINFIEDIIVKSFKKLVKGESNRIFKVINIEKIVEEKINDFDIEEMVNIMYGIVKKDVLVMRLFEAGIGFLIGFLIPLFPYLQRGVVSLFK